MSGAIGERRLPLRSTVRILAGGDRRRGGLATGEGRGLSRTDEALASHGLGRMVLAPSGGSE